MPRRAELVAALPTFFDDHGEIDRATTSAHLHWLASQVDSVFVAGTTGEFPALDRAERLELAHAALEVFGPDGVVVHIGAASTRGGGVDPGCRGDGRPSARRPHALLPSGRSRRVTRHFAAVMAAAGDAAVYGYLFTERSGVVVEPVEFGRIAAVTGLAGAKLSGAANARVAEYLDALPAGASLWSGADTTLAAVVRRGGAGIVSGLSSAFPEPFVALADAVAAGDVAAEAAAQQRADAVLNATGGTVEGIKYGLALRVGFQNAAVGSDQRFQAAVSYSLMSPPRIGRRWTVP